MHIELILLLAIFSISNYLLGIHIKLMAYKKVNSFMKTFSRLEKLFSNIILFTNSLNILLLIFNFLRY